MKKSIRAVFKRASAHKNTFKSSQCLLLISVGQEAHEKERFESTINLINSSFKSCIISLYDSLQCYTMALNKINSPSHYREMAKYEGDLWLERNEQYYTQLTIPYKVVRWNTWLEDHNFTCQKNILLETMDSNLSYRKIFDYTINAYLDRYLKRIKDLSSFNVARARNLCFDYILEECVVLCLWHGLNCHFEIYPGRHNDAIEETRKRFVTPYYSNLLHPISIDFINAKQVKPQVFHTYSLEKRMVL